MAEVSGQIYLLLFPVLQFALLFEIYLLNFGVLEVYALFREQFRNTDLPLVV